MIDIIIHTRSITWVVNDVKLIRGVEFKTNQGFDWMKFEKPGMGKLDNIQKQENYP